MLKNIGIAGGACGLVIGAALAAFSVAGLVHDRDRWHALAQRPAPTVTAPATPAPTRQAGPAARAPSPAPPVSPTPLVVPAARTTARPAPPPSSPPAPAPTKSSPPITPHTAACPSAQLLTVRLPLGVLPCNTITVAHVASIGGTGR